MSRLNWSKTKRYKSYEEIDTSHSRYRAFKDKNKAKRVKTKKKTIKDLQSLINKRDESF